MSKPAPVRIVVRSLTAMALEAPQVFAPVAGDNLLDIFMFNLIASAAIRHIPYGSPDALRMLPGGADGGTQFELQRPITAHSIAQSLALPYETVRMRIRRMVERGLLAAGPKGVVVSTDTLSGAALAKAYDDLHAVFLRTVEVLNGIAFDFAGLAAMTRAEPPTGPSSPPPRLVARVVLDFHLRCIEGMVRSYGDLTLGAIWGGITHANVRWMATSPELNWRYAAQDSPPPDDLRQPISVRALAAELKLPYETVRRHVRALIDRGAVCEVARRGVYIPAVMHATDEAGRHNLAFMQFFVRMVGDLTRLGFDFAVAGAAGAAGADPARRTASAP